MLLFAFEQKLQLKVSKLLSNRTGVAKLISNYLLDCFLFGLLNLSDSDMLNGRIRSIFETVQSPNFVL